MITPKIQAPFEGKHSELTGRIIRAYYTVYNQLGFGFAEKVYENALTVELTRLGLQTCRQLPIHVYYADAVVGEYVADVVVEDTVLIELKAVRKLTEEHEAQLLNYLKATTFEVGLLLNFGPKAEFERKVFDNARKGSMSWLKPS